MSQPMSNIISQAAQDVLIDLPQWHNVLDGSRKFKLTSGIDWVAFQITSPTVTNGTYLDKLFAAHGCSHSYEIQSGSEAEFGFDFIITMQNPSQYKLELIKAYCLKSGFKIGAIDAVEFYLDVSVTNKDIEKEITLRQLEAVAQYLVTTLNFRHPEYLGDVHGCHYAGRKKNCDNKVTRDCTFYSSSREIRRIVDLFVRCYVKTTDGLGKDGAPQFLPVGEYRARIEWQARNHLLPCSKVDDLPEVDWHDWLFKQVGYAPREPKYCRKLLNLLLDRISKTNRTSFEFNDKVFEGIKSSYFRAPMYLYAARPAGMHSISAKIIPTDKGLKRRRIKNTKSTASPPNTKAIQGSILDKIRRSLKNTKKSFLADFGARK